MKPKALDCCRNYSFFGAGMTHPCYGKLQFLQQSRAFGFRFQPQRFRLLTSAATKVAKNPRYAVFNPKIRSIESAVW